MDQIRKQVAEMAIRLLELPEDRLRSDPEMLAAIERLATQVLKEVAAVRVAASYMPGERSGCWRIVNR